MLYMLNIVVEICFIVISLFTWLSVSFKCASFLVDENKIFAKTKSAIIFYFINGLVSIVMTTICYILVCIIQIMF